MAYQFNGTNQYLSTAFPPVTAPPLTMVCWFRTNNVTSTQNLMEIGTDSGTGSHGFRLFTMGALVGDPIQADYGSQGLPTGQVAIAISTTGYTAANYFHAAAVFPDNQTATVFLNGGGSATATGTALTPAITRLRVGARVQNGALGLYRQGEIAEVGVWNAALTAAEIASLARGMTCDKVRPQNLVFYAPLVRNLQDVKGGLTITNNNGATVANHPRIYS